MSFLQRCLETNAAVLADMEAESAADREQHRRYLQELADERVSQPWGGYDSAVAGQQLLGMPAAGSAPAV